MDDEPTFVTSHTAVPVPLTIGTSQMFRVVEPKVMVDP